MQQTEQLLTAIEQYLAGKATAAQRQMVNDWYHSFDDERVTVQTEDADYERLLDARLRIRIAESTGTVVLNPEEAKTLRLWPRIAVAAAAVAAITLGVWFYTSRHPDAGQDPGSAQYATDIAPGKNGATITLANGKVIQLSDAKSGVVIGQDLRYSDGSPLSPQGGSLPEGERSVMLTASTAKGQTYQFTLPDGTKVWLNADSKLEFPSNFVNSRTRFVKLSGEGYFEVEKDKAHPFIVATDKQEVEVLGTHFNINAYKDESNTRTTLLEGSVSVRHAEPEGAAKRTISVSRNSKGGGPDLYRSSTAQADDVVLKPKQQSVLLRRAREGLGLTGSNRIKVQDVDIDEAIAWKNGYFMFESEEIGPIMRKIARWYNLEIVYGSAIPTDKFWGTVSRFSNVSQVLKKLELTGKVHFKIEGRRITVNK